MPTEVHFDRKKIYAELRSACAEGLTFTLIEAQNILKGDILNRQGTGTVYKRKGRRNHQASAKGQPPAPDTGLLRNSWTVSPIALTPKPKDQNNVKIKQNKKTLMTFSLRPSRAAGLGSAIVYAKILEDETKLDRPFLKPLVKILKARKVLQFRVSKAIRLRSIKLAEQFRVRQRP